MRIKGRLLTSDFEQDTLTISLPEGFWSEKCHVIRAGEVIIETEDILPPRNKKCNNCLSGLIHESEGKT